MSASRNLHNTMFQGVVRARMYFFHTNPSGRILNRFSKDMGQVDELLPAVMIDVVQIFLQLIGIIVVVVVVNYYFIAPTLIVAIIFYYLRGYYLSASRNIKRLEAISSLILFWFSIISNSYKLFFFQHVLQFILTWVHHWMDWQRSVRLVLNQFSSRSSIKSKTITVQLFICSFQRHVRLVSG